MRRLEALVRQLPGHELILHRHYANDPDFRSLCHDWLDAVEACERWQAAGKSNAVKAAEYRLMENEIKVEILQRVQSERIGNEEK